VRGKGTHLDREGRISLWNRRGRTSGRKECGLPTHHSRKRTAEQVNLAVKHDKTVIHVGKKREWMTSAGIGKDVEGKKGKKQERGE